jgi:hypothetical protein
MSLRSVGTERVRTASELVRRAPVAGQGCDECVTAIEAEQVDDGLLVTCFHSDWSAKRQLPFGELACRPAIPCWERGGG